MLNVAIKKIRFNQLIFVFQLVFIASLFLLFSEPALATVTQDNTAGTYTDDFASNTGVPTRSYVNVNTDTDKLQLTSSSSEITFTAPYKTSGYAITGIIRPSLIAEWKTITFTSSTPENTTLLVQVTDDGGDLFSDTYIPGNSAGIASSTIDISSIPILACAIQTADANCDKPYTIKVKFLMTTTDASTTPTVDDLVISWTTTQGDLSVAGLNTGAWPTANVDQKSTLHSAYSNSSIYPAFKWASDKYTSNYAVDRLWVLSDKIFGYSSVYNGYMFARNRDTGLELWKIPFDRCSGPEGTISSNGTFYGTDIGCDGFYVVDTNTGQVKWMYNFSGGHGNDHTVITSDGTIYTIRYNTSGITIMLYAFNPNGSIKWRQDFVASTTPGDAYVYPSQLAISSDETLYFGFSTADAALTDTNHGKLYAVNSSDGSAKWTYPTGDLVQSAPVIDSEGIIYVVKTGPDPTVFIPGVGWDYPSADKEVYAINPDGTLKWKKGIGTEEGSGYRNFSLRSDGVLLSIRKNSDSLNDPYKMAAVSTIDGSLLWEKDTEAYDISFTDSNNGVIYIDSADGVGANDYYTQVNYYDSDDNFKWKIAYLYNYYDGTDINAYALRSIVQDERGWMYGSLGKTYYDVDNAYAQVLANQFAQTFAMAPWTLVDNSITYTNQRIGDTLTFNISSSMLQTNPLFGGNNQAQIVIDNGDKVTLTYDSTDSSGNSIWKGTYSIPSSITNGTHTYTIEASQPYVVTDITTNFASAPTESSNTGISASGSFTVYRGIDGGGAPAEAYNPPKEPVDGFKVLINQGAGITSSRNVVLNFNAGSDVKKMAISMTGDFTDAGLQDYQSQIQWDFCSKASCPDGKYSVYAKFYTVYGQTSKIVSNSIVLKTSANNIGIGSSTSTGLLTLTLKLGSRGKQVVLLQNILKKLKFFPEAVDSTGYFGTITKQAVQKFQCEYNIVCSGNEQTTGYGQVGPRTRERLNQTNE